MQKTASTRLTEAPNSQTSNVQDVVVYTYATHSQDLFPVLCESAKRYGYKLKVVGWGQQWSGYCAKLLEMRDKLRDEDPDTLVLCVDAFDVFLCRPAQELRAEFEASGHKFVVGAHRPTNETLYRLRFNDEENVDGPYKFLCAGTWLARAANALHILSQFKRLEPGMDDQEMFIALRRKMGPNQIALDKDFRFFATLSPSFPFWTVDERDQIVVKTDSATGLPRLYSRLKKTEPFVVHGPGQSDLTPLLAQFDFQSQAKPATLGFVAEKALYHASVVARIWAIEIVAGLLVLALASFVLWQLARRKYPATPETITSGTSTKRKDDNYKSEEK